MGLGLGSPPSDPKPNPDPIPIPNPNPIQVLQSSFESDVKAAWLGAEYAQPGEGGNAIARTNVPNLRIEFRHLLLTEEMEVLWLGLGLG